MVKILRQLWTFLYKKDADDIIEISEEEYYELFIAGRKKEEIEATYKQAWQAKNFEIDNYWKRTTYFWAFQIASFTGYFSVMSSKAYMTNYHVLYFITCIGFITALAWTFVNRGSKTWQRHWEIHVDMLEDKITGPLYKVVSAKKTFSVSKINDTISRFITCIWILLMLRFFLDHITIKYTSIDWLTWLSSILTIYFSLSMYLGYGRGRFGVRKFTFYKRQIGLTNGKRN